MKKGIISSLTKNRIFILFFFNIAFYAHTIFFDFIWDDHPYIIRNSLIKNLSNFPLFFTRGMPSLEVELHYRPISTLFFALDYAIWGLNPFGFHLTNVLLNALASVLVFLLLNLFITERYALLGALLFSIHPTHLDTVAYVMARGDMLSALFFFISFYLYINSRDSILRSLLSILSFFASLLTKEMSITLPLIIIAYEIYKSSPLKIVLKKSLPYFLVLIVYSIIRFVVLPEPLGQANPLLWSFLTSFRLYFEYLRLLIFPYPLKPIYDTLPIYKTFSDLGYLPYTFIFLCVLASIIYLKRKNKLLFFSALFVLITLIPVSGYPSLIDISPIAERYLYLPSLGFVLFVAIFIETFKFLEKKLSAILSLLILILLSLHTISYSFNYKNQERFLTKMIKDGSKFYGIYYDMGQFKLLTRRYEEAEHYFKIAISLSEGKMNIVQVYNTLANLYNAVARYRDALSYYNKALELEPTNHEIINNIGVTYQKSDDFKLAESYFLEALRINPSFYEAYYNLGYLYWKLGYINKAHAFLTTAFHLKPSEDLIRDIDTLEKLLIKNR